MPVRGERGRARGTAANVMREEGPPAGGRVHVSLGGRRHARAAGCWLRARCCSQTAGSRAISLKSFARGDVKIGPRVCELGVPSKKPHHSVPAECMMLAEKRKVQPQPCTKDNIVNDLKADNILAFQMSLLIFPPFRTAKSLHGCF